MGLMFGKIFMLLLLWLCVIVEFFIFWVNVWVFFSDGEWVNIVLVYLLVSVMLLLDELVWKIIGWFCGECWMLSGFFIWKKWFLWLSWWNFFGVKNVLLLCLCMNVLLFYEFYNFCIIFRYLLVIWQCSVCFGWGWLQLWLEFFSGEVIMFQLVWLLLSRFSEVNWWVMVNGLLQEVDSVLVRLIFFVVVVSVDSSEIGLKWLRKCGIDFLLIYNLLVMKLKVMLLFLVVCVMLMQNCRLMLVLVGLDGCFQVCMWLLGFCSMMLNGMWWGVVFMGIVFVGQVIVVCGVGDISLRDVRCVLRLVIGVLRMNLFMLKCWCSVFSLLCMCCVLLDSMLGCVFLMWKLVMFIWCVYLVVVLGLGRFIVCLGLRCSLQMCSVLICCVVVLVVGVVKVIVVSSGGCVVVL